MGIFRKSKTKIMPPTEINLLGAVLLCNQFKTYLLKQTILFLNDIPEADLLEQADGSEEGGSDYGIE